MSARTKPRRYWCECCGWTREPVDATRRHGRCETCYRQHPAGARCRANYSNAAHRAADLERRRRIATRPPIRHGHTVDPFATPAGAGAPPVDGWGRPDQ